MLLSRFVSINFQVIYDLFRFMNFLLQVLDGLLSELSWTCHHARNPCDNLVSKSFQNRAFFFECRYWIV